MGMGGGGIVPHIPNRGTGSERSASHPCRMRAVQVYRMRDWRHVCNIGGETTFKVAAWNTEEMKGQSWTKFDVMLHWREPDFDIIRLVTGELVAVS
jgi:hypothetical protein